jgi:hypothetical protein
METARGVQRCNAQRDTPLKIVDVQGDGHCFYRCLYRIVRGNPDLRRVFLTPVSHFCQQYHETEDEAVGYIRESVASSFWPETDVCHSNEDFELASSIVQNLVHLKLNERAEDIDDMLPLLQSISRDMDVEDIMEAMFYTVKDTATFASAVEIDIVKAKLERQHVHLAVISFDSQEPMSKHIEKWLSDLASIMRAIRGRRVTHGSALDQTVACGRMAVLVNYDNVHYKVMRFRGKYLFDFTDFFNYVQSCIESYHTDGSDSSVDD